MASVVAEILESLLEALRATGKFRMVALGQIGSDTDVPRCGVQYDGQEAFQPDDSAAAKWVRLRAGISVRTRSVDPGEGVTRVNELCEAAMESLLADPFRGGRCHDLPIGRATEVGRCQLARGLKRPEMEMTFDVRCHFEAQEAS